MIVSKFGGRSYASCRAHLGIALDQVTGPDRKSANVTVMNVKALKDESGHLVYVCSCKKPAVFYVFEVEERPDMIESPEPDPGAYLRPDELAQPEAGAPVTECRNNLVGDRVHHMACVRCGTRGNDWREAGQVMTGS
jgi:hypothetical protein